MHESRLTMLGDLERAVMDVAWSRPHVTVREVVSLLPAGRKPAYTTVMTVMNRLVDKGDPEATAGRAELPVCRDRDAL
jgi:predicted transcriptional regulator